MIPRPLLGLLLCAFAACEEKAFPLFACQKACEDFRRVDGSPREIRRTADLLGLEPGKRYKYVVDKNGRFLVAPKPADVPGNPFHHPVLGRGEAVRTGGYVTVVHAAAQLARVEVDEDTKGYCATWESLAAARVALLRAGVSRALLSLVDRPPGCAPRIVRP